MAKWARCNRDGKPIHPEDVKILEKFKEWLVMTPEEREAAKSDPEWQEFLGIGKRDNV